MGGGRITLGFSCICLHSKLQFLASHELMSLIRLLCIEWHCLCLSVFFTSVSLSHTHTHTHTHTLVFRFYLFWLWCSSFSFIYFGKLKIPFLFFFRALFVIMIISFHLNFLFFFFFFFFFVSWVIHGFVFFLFLTFSSLFRFWSNISVLSILWQFLLVVIFISFLLSSEVV